MFDTLSLGSRWQLNGGVRFDRYDADYANLAPCGGRRGPDCAGAPEGTVLPNVDVIVHAVPYAQTSVQVSPISVVSKRIATIAFAPCASAATESRSIAS